MMNSGYRLPLLGNACGGDRIVAFDSKRMVSDLALVGVWLGSLCCDS